MQRKIGIISWSTSILGVTMCLNMSAAQAKTRFCAVQEALPADAYTYILCQGSNDVWLAASLKNIVPGEQLSYVDAPPLANYRSKSLGRVFSGVIITDVWRTGESRPAKAPSAGAPAAPPYEADGSLSDKEVYVGTDENGTIVFSDDPEKTRNLRRPSGTARSNTGSRK